MKNINQILLSMLFLLAPLQISCNAESNEGEKAEANPPATGVIKAADFTLKDMLDKDISLAEYKGKVVILDFWATWCPPCVKEIPHFNELAKDYKDKGLEVLGVSVDRDGIVAVDKFKQNNEINYPIVFSKEAVYKKYQSYLPEDERGGIPFTFVIDKEGNIRNHYVGYRPKEVFIEAIKPLL